MTKIELICDVSKLAPFCRYSDYTKIEKEYDVSIDYWLVDDLDVQFIYKYEGYCVYQTDEQTLILDNYPDDYAIDDVLFLAEYFNLGSDFRMCIYGWKCEEVCFKLYTPHPRSHPPIDHH